MFASLFKWSCVSCRSEKIRSRIPSTPQLLLLNIYRFHNEQRSHYRSWKKWAILYLVTFAGVTECYSGCVLEPRKLEYQNGILWEIGIPEKNNLFQFRI